METIVVEHQVLKISNNFQLYLYLEPNNVCPANSRPYLLRQKPVECRSNVDCMPTFECIKNDSLLIGYCCSKNRDMIRVESKRPLIHSNCENGSPPIKTPDDEIQLCIPNELYQCPSDYNCKFLLWIFEILNFLGEFNAYYGRYQCCSQNTTVVSSKTTECPDGMSLQIHPSTGSALQCEFDSDCANFVREKKSILISHLYFQAQCQKLYGVCCEANDLKTLLKITQKSQVEPSFLSGLLPGQIGCISNTQCQVNHPASKCIDWTCHCELGLFAFESTCGN